MPLGAGSLAGGSKQQPPQEGADTGTYWWVVVLRVLAHGTGWGTCFETLHRGGREAN